ncbi:unnamed protein product, partial [Brassica rapa]
GLYVNAITSVEVIEISFAWDTLFLLPFELHYDSDSSLFIFKTGL